MKRRKRNSQIKLQRQNDKENILSEIVNFAKSVGINVVNFVLTTLFAIPISIGYFLHTHNCNFDGFWYDFLNSNIVISVVAALFVSILVCIIFAFLNKKDRIKVFHHKPNRIFQIFIAANVAAVILVGFLLGFMFSDFLHGPEEIIAAWVVFIGAIIFVAILQTLSSWVYKTFKKEEKEQI